LERIRVVLAEMPPILRDVLARTLADQPDMVLVGELGTSMELILAAGETRADVVILGLDDAEFPGVASHLLGEYPHLKFLGVSADGRNAYLCELRPWKVRLMDVSPQGLVGAIRMATTDRRDGGVGMPPV
jgi:DNA-binding NarL/FixJ family response regulator